MCGCKEAGAELNLYHTHPFHNFLAVNLQMHGVQQLYKPTEMFANSFNTHTAVSGHYLRS